MTTSTLSRVLGAVTSCCLLLPAGALAASPGNGEQTPLELAPETTVRAAQSTPGAGGGLIRTIVGLAVVIGVIYGLHWVLKQIKASREERHSGTGLGTLATLPLGPNRSLHLVRAGSELVLVGVGEHGVTPIRTYSDAEARQLGLLSESDDDDDRGTPAGPFAGGASSLGGKVGAALVRKRPAGPGTGTVSRLVDDLRSRTVIR
ncbi:MAG: flagellar biosynthetic protein FliO [Actinomycetota bacterium]|nr:flagellar biosynthetic protein FliO [Actinomycetota bacterium]